MRTLTIAQAKRILYSYLSLSTLSAIFIPPVITNINHTLISPEV